MPGVVTSKRTMDATFSHCETSNKAACRTVMRIWFSEAMNRACRTSGGFGCFVADCNLCLDAKAGAMWSSETKMKQGIHQNKICTTMVPKKSIEYGLYESMVSYHRWSNESISYGIVVGDEKDQIRKLGVQSDLVDSFSTSNQSTTYITYPREDMQYLLPKSVEGM